MAKLQQNNKLDLFWKNIVDNSPVPTFLIDKNGLTVFANKAFLKVYNVPSEEAVLGMNALTEPNNIKFGVVKYFEEALTGKYVELPEVDFISPYNNARVVTKTKMYPLFDPDNKFMYVVVVQEDITKLKIAEEEKAKIMADVASEKMRLEMLEKFKKLTTGRELKMIELKKELELLKNK